MIAATTQPRIPRRKRHPTTRTSDCGFCDRVVNICAVTGLLEYVVTRTARILLVVPLLLVDAAYGDDAIPRYVAQQGEDRGDCTLPVRPCRTIQYALSVAGKGDQVRVAGGAYRFDDVQELLPLIAGAVDVRGGFNRFDHFLRQSAAANRTVLEGIPVALRDRLQDRGFQVIVDRKGLDAAGRRVIANYEVTQTSSGATACADDFAGAYPCKDVDLHAHMATSDLSTAPYSVADIWGFVDLNTEREYALLGLSNGLAVIDVTDPATPFEVGTVPGRSRIGGTSRCRNVTTPRRTAGRPTPT